MKSLYLILLFIGIQVLIATSCINDDNQQQTYNQTEEEKLTEEKTDSIKTQSLINNIAKPVNADISLIAMKYKINDSIAEKIIWEYSKVHSEAAKFFSILFDLKSDSVISDSILLKKIKRSELEESKVMTINRLSKTYNISTDTLAYMIYDYEVWMAVKQEPENDY